MEPDYPAWLVAASCILYGLGCIALGILIITGAIAPVTYAGAFEALAFFCGVFMIAVGALAFWWL